MSAIDLNNLKLKEETIDIDLDSYVDPSEFPPPLPEGIYTFIQGKPEFEATKEGFLSANMTHKVGSGEFEGRTLSFDRVSNKPFERQGVKVTMANDHLRAIGDRNRYSTHQEYATALAAGEGKVFQAQVAWEGYCGHKDTPHEGQQAYNVKGERNFPSNGGGQHVDSVICPTCKNEVRARNRISRRIPAQPQGV